MGLFNKLKNAFGNAQSNEEHLDGSYMDDIISSIENVPFAASQSNVLYGGINELAGFHYMQTVVVGTFKLKTNKGAKLSILGDDFKLVLNSDMLELASEVSNVLNRYVTKIDFEIEADDIPKIVKSRINALELMAKEEQVIFKIIEIVDEEEE